jgi:hypothetical protein
MCVERVRRGVGTDGQRASPERDECQPPKAETSKGTAPEVSGTGEKSQWRPMEDEGAWLHMRGEGKKGVGREMERHIARERHFASHLKLRRVRDSHLRFAGAGEKSSWKMRVRGCTCVERVRRG